MCHYILRLSSGWIILYFELICGRQFCMCCGVPYQSESIYIWQYKRFFYATSQELVFLTTEMLLHLKQCKPQLSSKCGQVRCKIICSLRPPATAHASMGLWIYSMQCLQSNGHIYCNCGCLKFILVFCNN